MRLFFCVLAVTFTVSCSKPATPAALKDFQMPIGTSKFAACTDANDGKRFELSGTLVMNGDVRVSDGTVSLGLYETAKNGEGSGAYTYVDLKDGKHIEFDVKDAKTKSAGFRRSETTGSIEGVTLHTSSGDASIDEPVKVVVELSVQRVFQQTEIFGCSLEVIELKK
ncbi:MAG: hypothetical protein ACO1OB_28455 [Archangium sp.]